MIPQFPGSAPARVLLALLLHRNEQSERCDPSIPTIMADTGLTKSGVLRAMTALEKVGVVERRTTRGRRTAYRVVFKSSAQSDTSSPSDTGSSAQTDTTTSARSDTKLVHDPTPEQPNNSQDQQPRSTAAAARAKSDPEEAWLKESPANYPGVRNWEAFVSSKIRKGEMPEAVEDDFTGSLRARENASNLSPRAEAYLSRLRRETEPQAELEAC